MEPLGGGYGTFGLLEEAHQGFEGSGHAHFLLVLPASCVQLRVVSGLLWPCGPLLWNNKPDQTFFLDLLLVMVFNHHNRSVAQRPG